MEESVFKLAVAIIEQAVKDYRSAYRDYLRNPSAENKSRAEGIERFFHSQWYGCLTDLDGEELIKRIQALEKDKHAIC